MKQILIFIVAMTLVLLVGYGTDELLSRLPYYTKMVQSILFIFYLIVLGSIGTQIIFYFKKA